MNVRLGNGPAAPATSFLNILAVGFGLLIVVGSFGTWASADLGFGSLSATGVEFPKNNSDGVFLLAHDTIGMKEGIATILLAVVGVALLVAGIFAGPSRLALGLVSTTCFGLASAVAITDWITVQTFSDPLFDIGFDVGWGVYVAAFSAVAATGLSLAAALMTGPTSSGARRNHFQDGQVRRQDTWGAEQGTARIGVLEGGRRRPDFAVRPGRTVTIGRAANSDIQLQDRHVGHQQLVVAFEHGSWSVRDVGRTNHARVLRPGVSPVMLDGHPARPMSSGQLAIGDVVITLFPVEYLT